METKQETQLRNENGTIKKGTVLNPKGRPKGSVNRTTAELKELVKTYVEGELEQADSLLNELTAKERLDILCKMLPYVMPKQQEINPKDSKEITISFID